MSTDDAAGKKAGHDRDGLLEDLPGDWWPGAEDEDAFLVHESGAKLVLIPTPPTTQPAPDATARAADLLELDFQPANTQHLRVLIKSGTKCGLRDAALAFAREHPGADPPEEAFAHPAAWEGVDE